MSLTEKPTLGLPQRPVVRGVTYDGAILALWRLGLDTFDIARKLWIPESRVANRLAFLRDGGAA